MAPNPVNSPYAAERGHMESLRGPYAVRRLPRKEKPRKEKGVETPVTLLSFRLQLLDPADVYSLLLEILWYLLNFLKYSIMFFV